jgi:hypothetical protein
VKFFLFVMQKHGVFGVFAEQCKGDFSDFGSFTSVSAIWLIEALTVRALLISKQVTHGLQVRANRGDGMMIMRVL